MNEEFNKKSDEAKDDDDENALNERVDSLDDLTKIEFFMNSSRKRNSTKTNIEEFRIK